MEVSKRKIRLSPVALLAAGNAIGIRIPFPTIKPINSVIGLLRPTIDVGRIATTEKTFPINQKFHSFKRKRELQIPFDCLPFVSGQNVLNVSIRLDPQATARPNGLTRKIRTSNNLYVSAITADLPIVHDTFLMRKGNNRQTAKLHTDEFSLNHSVKVLPL